MEAILMVAAKWLLPALVPALADGARGLFARWTQGAGASPQNVAEAIQLMQAQTERVRALAELDKLAPNASAWVADLRGAFRYVAVGGIIMAALVVTLAAAFGAEVEAAAVDGLLDLAGACMVLIIGERFYLKVRS